MNEGQHRLKEAFERTRVLHRYHIGEDAYMIDNGATKSNGGMFDSGEQNEVILNDFMHINVKLFSQNLFLGSH